MKKEDIILHIIPLENFNNEMLTETINKILLKNIKHLETRNKGIYFNMQSAAILDLIRNIGTLEKLEEMRLKQAFLSGVLSSKCLIGEVSHDIFYEMANLYIQKINEEKINEIKENQIIENNRLKDKYPI